MLNQEYHKNKVNFQSGHTFSAKEKDDVLQSNSEYQNINKPLYEQIERSEDSRTPVKNKKSCEQTGYSYTSTSSVRRFGARYGACPDERGNSVPIAIGIRVWLSVDPLASKYPSQSPYSYVGNRPIMVIDPKGEDEWEVTDGGCMSKVKTTDNDVIYKVNENGDRNGEKHEFNGKVMSVREGTQTFENKKGKAESEDYTDIQFSDSKSLEDAFSFMEQNTDVEWAKTELTDNNSGVQQNILTTSHLKDKEVRSGSLLGSIEEQKSFDLIHEHSHPRNERYNHYSSEADRNFRDRFKGEFHSSDFKIRYDGDSRSYKSDTQFRYWDILKGR